MNYLHLSDEFTPDGLNPINQIKFEKFIFSGGEPHIKIDGGILNKQKVSLNEIMITTRINSFNDLGLLAVAVDSLKRYPRNNTGRLHLELFLPYFPGARQDRVMVPGEPLTVKVYADIINSMGFAKVTIVDPHSDVTPAVLDNCTVMDNHKFVRKSMEDILINHKDTFDEERRFFYMISPDAGSNKKMKDVMSHLSTVPITLGEDTIQLVKCDKTRNVTTGEITGFDVYTDDLNRQDCIIVDDICDGGGTFMGLAEELKKKGAGDLYLVVTHGIFSNGFKNLAKHFKQIYTTDSWVSDFGWEQKERDKTEVCTIIPLSECI